MRTSQESAIDCNAAIGTIIAEAQQVGMELPQSALLLAALLRFRL
jgi:hypothetical protein